MPNFKIPQIIKPELIQIGDDISVTHKAVDGVTTIVRGIVSTRQDLGSVRNLSTAEGGTLLAWEPGVNTGVQILLHGRIDTSFQGALFELDELNGVRARVDA